MLAVGDGLEHRVLGKAIAADQLDDDVDGGIIDDAHSVVCDPHVGHLADHFAGALEVLIGDRRDDDGATGAAGDLAGVAGEHGKRTAANSTGAEQADVDGIHSWGTFRKVQAVPW